MLRVDGVVFKCCPCSDVREVIVELAQAVVVFLIVQRREDAAAGQLWQILHRGDMR